ncbi:MAG: gamma-glutamyltransferase [Myxococcales bacterium]|nr:gamma-glutamyltransferase [Myxococcales bacterium]
MQRHLLVPLLIVGLASCRGAPKPTQAGTEPVAVQRAEPSSKGEAAPLPSAATAAAVALALASNATVSAAIASALRPVPTPAVVRRAVGKNAGVATAHPLATAAAMAALDKGGTAVDAWVAASFMLTVVTPQSTGIGGGGFAIVWPGTGKAPHAVDFREQAPADGRLKQYLDDKGKAVAKRSQRHGLAIGVPGYVAGLWEVHKRWGKRPWKELVAPAVRVAAKGFVMGDVLVDAAQQTWEVLSPSARAVIGAHDKAPTKGAVLRQPALAKTLEKIARKGPKGLYEGQVAADIVATVKAAGGHVSAADLKAYKPRWRKPLTGTALGLSVLTMPQPSAGGPQLVAMAEFMARFAPKAAPNPSESADTAHALAETMRRGFQLRLAFSGDTETPAEKLDDVYPAAVRKKLSKTFDPKRATPSAKTSIGKLERHNNTSHVSIIDRNGMAIASTHTVNLLFGSGILAAKSGVWLNNELDDFSFTLTESNAFGLAGSRANLFRPGARPVSSMTPTIFLKDNQPVLIVGSPGGTRIPTAVFQVAWRTLIAKQPLLAAIDAPRMHHQTFPDEVWVEEGKGEALWRKALEKRGHKVVAKVPWCDVQAVRIVRNKGVITSVEAVSDGRAEGSAAAK